METLVRAAPDGAFSNIREDGERGRRRVRWLLAMVSLTALSVAGSQIAVAQETPDEEAQAEESAAVETPAGSGKAPPLQRLVIDATRGNQDVLDVSAFFSSFAEVQASMAQVGKHTVITVDADNTITLQKIKIATLDADDFRFI